MSDHADIVLTLSALRRGDVGRVGGKNASLGEMSGSLKEAGIGVPGGFATTAAAVAAHSAARLLFTVAISAAMAVVI